VYALPGPPPTTESFISAVSNTHIDWAFVPPVVVDELGKRPDLLDVVASQLKYLFFTGGSVPKASGDVVAQKLPIWQVLGSSECASLPLVHAHIGYKDSEDWRYVQLNPLLKSEMRHHFDDLHELVIVRNAETETFQPVFAHFPETTEYETRDLFKPHPSKPGLWSYQSRIDDVIVFLNGEKTNPVTFEEEVISHPEVRAALVIGAQRLEAALLVELAADALLSEEEKAGVVKRIWPFVEKANETAPAHARISKEKILLVDPTLPMLRAGKGTVQRNATLDLYAGEIERLYQQDSGLDVGDANSSAQNDIQRIIRNLVAEMLGLDNLDFFQLGMDSLGVLRLQRALKRHFPEANISLNTVYTNSSVNALANALKESPVINGERVSNAENSTKELAKMLEDFSKEIDAIRPSTRSDEPTPGAKGMTILLTGSTGALGSYILHRLLSMTDVAHIYCFNRTSDAKDRQIKNNQARNLDTELSPERVTFLAGDLAKHNLGLPEIKYLTLLSEVTHIIHNAWPVNFNLSLPAFTSSLSGVVSLIRFSALSRRDSAIQFFSSISSVSSYPGYNVPEAVITELSTPAAMGYGQSKHLAEQLLGYASKTLGVNTSFVRIGQVAGAARTASGWSRQEWLPSLVISSAFIRAIPETLGDASVTDEAINWVPVDQLADVVVELTLNSNTRNEKAEHDASVFQVVHPNPVSWSSLLLPIKKTLEASCSSSESIRVVPYAEWISILKDKSAEAEEIGSFDTMTLARKNPAMKLLDFYESLQYQGNGLRMKLSMEKTLSSSKILQELEPLKNEWITGWVKEWIST
jgi:thioester reductase-like protein